MKVTKLPMDPGPAAWNDILPATPAHPTLDADMTADFLIIGAGFAGLSAARQLRLRDKTASVMILEARRVAEGPAGRNSGFMIDLPHNLASKHYAGEAVQDRDQTVMNRRAIAFASRASEDYALSPLAFQIRGKINAAATAKGSAHNQDYADHLTAINEPHELYDARQMSEICGSSYYESGLYTPGTAMLQPALYVRGFARGLAKDGVAFFENSPVIDLTREGRTWRAKTPTGSVAAACVILATNGHAESFGHYKQRLIHIYLYASLTRPLSAKEIARLGGDEAWGFTPADPMGTTVRKVTAPSALGGTRIVIRNSIEWAPNRETRPDKSDAFARRHDRSFTARFPMLKNVIMSHRWGGLLCLSRNAAPAFGLIDEGLISACCQNGLGTAIGTLSGMAAADLAMERVSDERAFFEAQAAPTRLPPAPLAALGAKTLFKWGEFKAGREL